VTLRRTCSNIVAVVATLVIGIPHGGTESPVKFGGPGDGKPVAIHIEIGDRSELADLTRLVSIEDVRGHEVLAAATPEQLRGLSEAGYDWRILPPAVKAADVTMCPPRWEEDPERPWSCYPSYDQYTTLMHRYASDHPTLCRIVDLGTSNNTVRPHRLWAVVISDNPDTDEAEPEVLLTSTMHGDETTGYVLMALTPRSRRWSTRPRSGSIPSPTPMARIAAPTTRSMAPSATTRPPRVMTRRSTRIGTSRTSCSAITPTASPGGPKPRP